MSIAATYHAVLKRMSTSAFISEVPTAQLTRVLLVFPNSALFVFYCFTNTKLASIVQFRVDDLLGLFRALARVLGGS